MTNPSVGLQSGWFPNTPQVPQQGLMGGQPSQAPTVPSLMNATPGDWSQVAYQMAGSPKQGGMYPTVPVPATIPGTGGGATTTSGSGSAIGGTVLGLLGSLAKNPSMLNSALGGLLGPTAAQTAAIGPAADTAATGAVNDLIGQTAVAPITGDGLGAAGGLMAGGDAALAPVGVDAVSELPSVESAVNAGASDSGVLGTGLSGAQALGAAALPLSLYGEISNYQSGATGTDALGGAESGAALGTAIMPGIGTAIGAVGGALAGALSSVFGPGKVDPENANFNQYTQAYNSAPAAQQAQVAAGVQNPYLPLAGYFDLRSDQVKGQNPIYSTYGRMGEQSFTNDLIGKVQQGQQSGITNSTQMWNQVISPWINSMGTWQDSNKNAMTALIQNMTGQIMGGTYQQNFKAVGGQTVFGNSASSAATPTVSLNKGLLNGMSLY